MLPEYLSKLLSQHTDIAQHNTEKYRTHKNTTNHNKTKHHNT